MKTRTIHMIEGTTWMVLLLANGAILVARMIGDQDYHHASISGLLCCILAKMAFKEARDA